MRGTSAKYRSCLTIVVASLLVLAVAPCLWADPPPHFRAGIAERDITPQAPTPMWGYGERHGRLSAGVLDPLMAKAVVIDTGPKKIAIVGVDLGRAPDFGAIDRIQHAVNEQAGVNHIMIVASHTHCGPVLELRDERGMGRGKYDDAVRYIGWLEQQLIDCIVEAANTVVDVKIGWGSKHVDLNKNRQTKFEPKPRDTELAVVRIDTLEGAPLAVLVNYAAHPIIIKARVRQFSSEYPGAMRDVVEKELNTFCVFLQGAAGDMKCLRPPEAEGYREFGALLGNEVVEIATGIETSLPANPSIHTIDREFEFDTRLNFGGFLVPIALRFGLFPEMAKSIVYDLKDNRIPVRLITVLINGNLALVGASGEFFCNHANRLKERSRAERTLFLGYCNGYSAYFPTIEAAAEGGYGADEIVNWSEVGAGEQMIDAALIDIYTLLGAF